MHADTFKLIAEPDAALATRLAPIAASDRTLDLQYFIWEPDRTGKALLHSLRKAADRGVRVRLLLDDLYNGNAKVERLLQGFAAHPNVEVRLFNPFGGSRSSPLSKLLGSLGDMPRA